MKRQIVAAVFAGCIASNAGAFDATPQFDASQGEFLECSIVKHSPDHDRDPPYKINIMLRVQNGVFQGLDVNYTLVSDRVVDRTKQYPNGKTWTSMPKTRDWFWEGTHKNYRNQGHLYHNDVDGWMYTEAISDRHGTYHMLADCHNAAGD